jgi:hypothetical protein
LRESRDSARDATREDQDDSRSRQGTRSSQQGQSSQRSSARSSEEFDDIHGDAQSSQRSSRDTERDQFDSRRDSSRDDQGYSRSQRDDYRDDQSSSRSQRDDQGYSRSQRDDYRDDQGYSRSQRDDRSRDFSQGRDDFRDRDDFRSREDSRQSSDSRRSSRDFDQSRTSDVDFNVQDVRPADVGLWFDRSNRDALVLSDVASSGAITRFGFREGDQILSVNGWRVADQTQFMEYLFDPDYRNQRMEVVVWRNGRRVPISVQPSALVQEYTSYSTQQSDPLEEYGLVLDDRYPNYTVVWKVQPRTPAYYAGIRPGDTIVSWDGYRFSSPQQFTTYVQRGWTGPIDLQVSRNRQIRQLQLDMDGARRTALRPGARIDTRGNVDVDRVLPGRENRIENRIERREGVRDGSFGTYSTPGATYSTQGGTYYTQPSGTYYTQPGTGTTIQGQAGGVGVQAGADTRPGLLPRVRGRND